MTDSYHSWLWSDFVHRRDVAKRNEMNADHIDDDRLATAITEALKDAAVGSRGSFYVNRRGMAVYKSCLDDALQPRCCMIFDITVEEIQDNLTKAIHKRLKKRKDYKWGAKAIRDACLGFRESSREQVLVGPRGTSPILVWVIGEDNGRYLY